MAKPNCKSSHRKWAEFRHAVVGPLLSAPPERGELAHEIRRLSAKKWKHPVTGKDFKVRFSTIESWYYQVCREHHDPVGKLASKVRKDLGRSRVITPGIEELIRKGYKEHPYWTYQLHADNLAAGMTGTDLGRPPSVGTVRRFMQRHGLRKRRRPRHANRAGSAKALQLGEARETRSFEVEYVGSLYHLDFHHGSLQVVDERGNWRTPVLLGIFDDHSRLCCHMQWYLGETTEDLVHGFGQALQKRGLPRELLTDNGAAMTSDEFTNGLSRLGIIHYTTLPYHPEQNGKCEHVWSRVESRLMAMLDGYKDLTLKVLNDVTQAWVEMEYNRQEHKEIKEAPLDRFVSGKNVSRPSPSVERIRSAFRCEVSRTQRRSDGTIVLDGVRFEIPSPYRHIDRLVVRYARWDLSWVHLMDERSGKDLCRLFPLDKAKNADRRRRSIEDPIEIEPVTASTKLPALLQKYVDGYAGTGARPAYTPKTEAMNKE